MWLAGSHGDSGASPGACVQIPPPSAIGSPWLLAAAEVVPRPSRRRSLVTGTPAGLSGHYTLVGMGRPREALPFLRERSVGRGWWWTGVSRKNCLCFEALCQIK
jgi:hypothetical protein